MDFVEWLEKKEGKAPPNTQALKDGFERSFKKSLKGGSGSGNFGHAGRPGKRGGSQPNKGIGEVPAAFHGDRARYEEALKYFGGEIPKNWYLTAKSMTNQLNAKPGDYQYSLDFSNEALRQKYFIKPLTPDGEIDWPKYEDAQQAQKSKWTLSREEYAAVRDVVQSRGNARVEALRKKLGLPDSVDDLWGKDIYNEELNPYNRQKTDAERARVHEMYEQSRNMGRDIINKAGIQEYSPGELTQGLTDYYDAQLPAYVEGHTSPAGVWIGELDSGIKDAGRFETMHMISRGDWTTEEAKENGFSIENRYDEWQPLPGDLWHATTASDALEATGIKSRWELGMNQAAGLGGGSDMTISFATDKDVVKQIERTMHEAQLVASNQLSVKDLIDLARDGAGGVGHDWSWQAVKSDYDKSDREPDFNPFKSEQTSYQVQQLLDYESGKNVTESNKMWTPEAYADKKWYYYSGQYMWQRQAAGGFMNPLFWGTDYKKLARTDPTQFKSHNYAPSSKKATGWGMGGLSEWRVVGGDTVKLKKVVDFYDPADPDFLQKVLYGG